MTRSTDAGAKRRFERLLRNATRLAIGIALAWSLVIDSRYLTTTLYRLPGSVPVLQVDRLHAKVLGDAAARIRIDEPIAVVTDQAPFFFAYYLFPRPAYLDSTLTIATPATASEPTGATSPSAGVVDWDHPLLERQSIDWIVGAQVHSR